MKRFRQMTAAVCLLLLWAAGLAIHAQTNKGQLAGNVTDQTGAYISGATVTARN